MEEARVEVNPDKVYSFPADVTAVPYEGCLLLITPENGNWIVIENQVQADMAKMLSQKVPLRRVHEAFPENEADLEHVVGELEGRHFCERIDSEEDDFTLRIYLTNACNLRCRHCFMYAAHSLEHELTYEEIIDLLDKSRANHCSKVIFTGGEIALKKRFVDILRHAHDLGLYVQVLSNGVLWTDEIIKETANYIDEIQVSIDGFDEASNARIRGAGTFERSLHTIEKFVQEKKPFVSVITTPLYGFRELYKDKYIAFGKEMIKRFGTDHFLVIYGKELLNGRDVKANVEKNKIMTKLVDEIYEEIYPNAELNTFVVNHKYGRIYRNCGYGGLTVNSNGDFFFCGRVYEVGCYGNIRTTDFQEVLKKRKTARQKTYVDNILPCRDCDIRLVCGGNCRVSEIPEVTHVELDEKTPVFERTCEDVYKENLYRLMVESSEFLYW